MPIARPPSALVSLRRLLLPLLAGCTSITEPQPGPALTSLPRPLTAGEQKVLSATNDFSFNFFRQLSVAQKDTNIFTSPLSASFALGMTMNGAANATLDQMRSTLAFGAATEPEINEGYKSLIALLRGLDNTIDIRIANGIWYRTGYTVKQSFLDAGRTYFDAQIAALDFSSAAAPKTVNDWVSTATAGKIPSIVTTLSDIDMLLVNAIYFKATWRQRFDPAETRDEKFHGINGDEPMRLMHHKSNVPFTSNASYSAVDLPYGDSAFTMTVVVPNNGVSLDAVSASLMKADGWNAMLGQMRPAQVDVFIPKLKLQWERRLNADLIMLGMPNAFDDNLADLSRLAFEPSKISYVKQKAYVDINEEGTEAAVATAVGVVGVTALLDPQIRADHPFLFVIRERLTGTIMFMGRIVRMP